MNVLLTNCRLNKPHQKKVKHTLISSSWPFKTTSTQRTTRNITDLYSEKTPPQYRGLLSEIKRDISYVPLHRYKCGNKIPGCLSEKVRQKGLMNSNTVLGDLINYAKTTETITKHLEQMRLEDANSTTKPTTSINALVNKAAQEQQRPRKHSQQNQCRNCNGKYPHERGPTSCPAFQNQCAYCKKWGHFTAVFFRKLNDEDRQRRTNRLHTHKPKPVDDQWTALRIINETQTAAVTRNMYSIQVK